jgi:hypothetical protein
MKKFFFVVFWGCFESYSMDVGFLVSSVEDSRNLESAALLGELPEHVNHVSMSLFHEMYRCFCSFHMGGNAFFNDFSEYDPPNDGNGNKNFLTRYTEWAAANHVTIPNNGDAIVI